MPGFVNPLVQYPPGTSVGTVGTAYTNSTVAYSPGFSFQLVGAYFPSIIEWAIVIGILAGAALLGVLGVHFLPLGAVEGADPTAPKE